MTSPDLSRLTGLTSRFVTFLDLSYLIGLTSRFMTSLDLSCLIGLTLRLIRDGLLCSPVCEPVWPSGKALGW